MSTGKINVRVSNQLWRVGIPEGGTTGQLLTKASAIDYDTEWADVSGTFAASGANSDITSLSGLTTPLSVPQGGTGAATLTEGGILLGSGTDAITPMAVLAKGTIVVGDGTTDPTILTVGSDDEILTADAAEASGLKWAAGSVGGIDYANPTTANVTGTLTPINGEYFTSTSKLITLLSNGTERFLPLAENDSGTTDGTTASKLVDSTQDFDADGTQVGDIVVNTTDTTRAKITAIDSATTLSISVDIMVSGENYSIQKGTRKIWGLGSSVAATLTVDPSSLVAGDIFSVYAIGGESRIIEYDGTDFLKIGGVVVPLTCGMAHTTAGPESIADNTTTLLPFDGTLTDPSGQMADPITNNRIDIIRSGDYRFVPAIFYGTSTSAHIYDHEVQNRISRTGTTIASARGYIHAAQQFAFGHNYVVILSTAVEGDYVELYALHTSVGLTEALHIFGPTASSHRINIMEINPW